MHRISVLKSSIEPHKLYASFVEDLLMSTSQQKPKKILSATSTISKTNRFKFVLNKWFIRTEHFWTSSNISITAFYSEYNSEISMLFTGHTYLFNRNERENANNTPNICVHYDINLNGKANIQNITANFAKVINIIQK